MRPAERGAHRDRDARAARREAGARAASRTALPAPLDVREGALAVILVPLMPCLVGCLWLSIPRVVLLALWLFTKTIDTAFQHNIWFLLGFLFLPVTTIAYVWARNANGSVEGIYLAAVIVGVLIDVGVISFGRPRRQRPGGGPRGPFGGGGAGDGGGGPSQGPREITVSGERVG